MKKLLPIIALILLLPSMVNAAITSAYSSFTDSTDFNAATAWDIYCIGDNDDGYATFCEEGGSCGNWRDLPGDLATWCDPGPGTSFSPDASFGFTLSNENTCVSFAKCDTDPGSGNQCSSIVTKADFVIGAGTCSGTPAPTTTATTTELTALHYDMLWIIWLITFICAYLWFESYYKT